VALVYLDSSVLLRLYLADEPGHVAARALVEGSDLLVTARWTVVEATSALTRASRVHRVLDIDAALAVLAADTGIDGAITLLSAPAAAVEVEAVRLCRSHGLRSLDALHLAVALLAARPLVEPQERVFFASRDNAQAVAARAEGMMPR
jgi:predicted nucleic acid-binding protein